MPRGLPILPRTMRANPCLRLLALCLAPSLLAAPEPGALVPAGLPVAGRIALASFVADFPGLARTGLVGAKLDELATRGFPDPRSTVSAVAFGATLGASGADQGVAVVATGTEILPQVRRVADEKGASLAEDAVRGVTFVTGTLSGKSSRFADLGSGLALAAFDRAGAYALTRAVVELAAGRGEAAFPRPMDGSTWLEVAMTLDEATRSALGEGKLHHLAHLVGGRATLARSPAGARLEVRAEATGGIKARLAAFALGSKLSGLAESAPDPAVRKVLASAKVDRDGATILVTAEASIADLEAAALAAQGLVRAKFEAKRAGAAK